MTVAKFSVAARTLVHLGAELITSDEVALNELIKNAFDAESERVKISFHIPVPLAAVQHAVAAIRAARTSGEIKAAIKAIRSEIETAVQGLPGGNERDALFEKLAVIESTTARDQLLEQLEQLNYLTVEDTGSGMTESDLEEVFLRIGTDSRLESHSSGKLQRRILGNKGIGRLAMMRLGDRASVTSWTRPGDAHAIDFDWRAFEDASKQIDDIPLQVRSVPQPRDAESGTVIAICALKAPWTSALVEDKVVNRFVRRLQNPFAAPVNEEEPAGFPIDIHVNNGRRVSIAPMKKVLADHAQADFELRFDPDGVEGAANEAVILVSELNDHRRGGDPVIAQRSTDDVLRKIGTELSELNDVGPFTAKIRWFNRDQLRKETTLDSTWKAAQKELDLWSGGIAIYRDGFRIGFTGQSTGEDWLGLDSSALKRSGFTVNRIQVVGALLISREDNPGLIDRSNREGLIDSRQANIVRQILIYFGIEELRRHIDHEGREDKKAQLEALVESAPATIRERATKAEQGLMEIRSKVSPEVRPTIKSIANHLHFIKSEVKLFEEASKQAIGRREDILELAGVGTVMSGVLHELTRTTGNTRQLLQKLSKGESPKTQALLDKLDAEVKAINTRLRQLDPLTPSGRHRKELFDLTALLRTIVDGYAARFERHEIKCELHIAGSDETRVMVNMVRGFVSLAVENLMTNSIYWVQQGLKAGETERLIELELDPVSRTLTFRDNGPGISASDKQRIFTAGFSLRHRGQGLGLFIAAEVATYHKAKLTLDSIDDDGRYRGFVLELPQE